MNQNDQNLIIYERIQSYLNSTFYKYEKDYLSLKEVCLSELELGENSNKYVILMHNSNYLDLGKNLLILSEDRNRFSSLVLLFGNDKEYLIKSLKKYSYFAIIFPFIKKFNDNSKEIHKAFVKENKEIFFGNSFEEINNNIIKEKAEQIRLKGNEMFHNKNYKEAVNFYLQGMKLEPKNLSLLINISQTYLKLDNYQNSLNFSNQLLKINKDDLRGNYIYFKSLLGLQKKEEAKKFLSENVVLKKDKNFKSLYESIEGESNIEKEIERKKENQKKDLDLNLSKPPFYDYLKLIKLEKEKLYLDNVNEYISTKLHLLEQTEKGTKIIAKDFIKKGELLCVSKALFIVTNNQNLSEFKAIIENLRSKIGKMPQSKKDEFFSLTNGNNIFFSLKERSKIQDLTDANLFKIYNLNSYNLGIGFRKKNFYEGSGLFLYPSFFNHSCFPNTTHFTIGDILFIISCFDIQKDEEINVSYFTAKSPLEIRQQKSKNFSFECRCKYCTYEINEIKNSIIKQECEKYKKIMNDYNDKNKKFSKSPDYHKIRNFILNNKNNLFPLDLIELSTMFDSSCREDRSTLKDFSIFFEEIFSAFKGNGYIDELFILEQLIAIYLDLNEMEKCENTFNRISEIMKSIFPNNPDFIEYFIQSEYNKDENYAKQRYLMYLHGK